MLDTFGRHRLLSFDRDPVTRGPTVEISHEALLTEWATLRDWIEAARDDLRTHRHLAVEMNAWLAADESADYLLRGGRLDSIAAWSETTTMGLRPARTRVPRRQPRRAGRGAAGPPASSSGARPTPNAERGGAPGSC